MPKDNGIIKGKIRKKKASIGSGYGANVLRSLGYSARDVLTDVMPNTMDTVSSARDASKELDDVLHMAAQKSKDLAAPGKSKLQELKENQIQEMLEDIKSGKLYNKERIKDPFDDFDFGGFGDFGDMDEDFDDGDSGSASLSMDFNIPEDSPIVESQDATTAMVSKSAEALLKGNKENSIAIAASVSKLASGITSGLQLLHEDITTMTTTIPKSLTEHAALSARYYEDSIGYQKKISESLDELKSMYIDSKKLAGSTNEKKESSLDKLIGLGLGSYKDLVASQAKSTVMGNSVVSLISSFADFYKMSAEMGGSKGLAATGLNMLLKTALGKGIKNGAGKLDSFIENLFLPVGMKIGKMQDDWGDPFKQFIGNIFGIKARPDLSVDKSKYEKGAVAFDGKVHRAITDVIPTYLRMITSALTGKEEIAFDYEKGVYNTVSNIQKKFDSAIKDTVKNEYYSERFDFGRIVDKLDSISKEQGQQIKDTFDNFLFNMAKSDDLVTFRKTGGRDDIAKHTGRTSDDPVVRIIRDYFEGLYNQGRHAELNEIFGRKSLNAKRSLEQHVKKMSNDATSSNYYLIDNGLYSSGQNTVWERDPIDDQIDKILDTYRESDPIWKDAKKRKEERQQKGLYGNKQKSSEAIKLANTGTGLGLDKYNRTNSSYLRDILTTLATGIKVVNVGTVDGGASAIISQSKRVLRSLQLDDSAYNLEQNAKRSPSDGGDVGNIVYDAEKALDVFTSILDDTRTEDDAINWLVNKFGNKNIIGRAATSLQTKRTAINKKADDIVTKLTGAGIDTIYGKRESSEIKSDDDASSGSGGTPVDPDTGIISTSPSAIVDIQLSRQFGRIYDVFREQVVDPLNDALFDEEEGLIERIEDVNLESNETESRAAQTARNIGTAVGTKAKNGLLGVKNDETGEYENGILSAEANMAAVARTNMTKWSHDLIYGTEDGKEKGLLGSVRSFFGETEDGKLNISGKAVDAGKTLKDHLIRRSYEWSELIFGKEEEGEEKKLDIFLGDMKGKKGEIAGAATVGVLGSFFLPGGPITGAIIGAGLGIVKNSNQLKDALFGEQDENGERTGNIITKETMDFFKKNGKPMKVGAGVGILGSIFLPGGPITGAIIGAGLGIAAKSEAFSNLLYGDGGTKEDPTGGIAKYIKEHYSKNKDVKATFLDAGIGSGVGLIGSFFLPGGPITGSLIGAGASIALNSDKFKDWFFGKEDPEDNNKRKGGVFGEIRSKLTEKVQGLQDDLSLWISDNITAPLKASMEPIKNKAKNFLFGSDDDTEKGGLLGAIAKQLDKSAFGDFKKTIKENVIGKIKNGMNTLLKGFGNIVGAIIKSPVLAIQAIAEDMDDDKTSGKASLAKRISELREKNKKKMEERKAKRGVRRSNSRKGGESTTTSSSAEDATEENTKETAEATSNAEKIVKEQLDVTKEEHSEKMGILQKILDRLPSKPNGGITDNDATTVGEATKITGDTLVERVDHNVEKITKSVDGQLDGVGYNINRIYKLLRKKLKKGDDDDDDDEDGDDAGEGNKKPGRIRRLLGKVRRFSIKNVIGNISEFIKKKITGAISTVLSIPKMLLSAAKTAAVSFVKGFLTVGKTAVNAAKVAIQKVGAGIYAAGKLAGKFVVSAGKQIWNVGKTAVKGFTKTIASVAKTMWSATKGLASAGLSLVKGVASLGLSIAKGVGKTALGAARGIGSFVKTKVFKKQTKENDKITRFIIDGGHLDYISVVKRVGGAAPTGDTGTASNNIANFPGAQGGEAVDDAQVAALQGGSMGLGSIKNSIRGKLSALTAKAKGSIGSIKAKFAKEDAEKEQNSWKEKIVSLLTRNTEGNEKHHLSWGSIFSKKGLITAGLIFLAPLILKAVGGIINFFKSGIGEDIANTLKSIAGWVTKAFGDEGGLTGMANNASENIHQVKAGLGKEEGYQYVIDENTGAIKTDENGELIKESTGKNFSLKNLFFAKKAHIDSKTGEVTNEATYDHTTQLLGKATKYATHEGIKITGKAVKIGKKVQTVAGKVASSKIGQKVAASAAGQATTGILSTAKTLLKKAINFVIEKFGALATKFGVSGTGISKLTQKITKMSSGLWDDTLLKKFSPTIQKLLAKMGISTGSALIAEVAFVGIGALGGALNPGELFEVNMDDVENLKTKAVMVAISTVYKGIMGSSIASWFDLACDIIYEVSGINLAKIIATFVLNLISGDETEADLSQAQAKFDERYDEAVQEQYEAWKKNQEESGQEAMSFEEFKQSDLAMSRSDFNLETNKTLGKRIFDGGKKLVSGVATAGKKAIAFYLPHKESVYTATDGTYYRKSDTGNYYDYYSPTGAMIATQIDESDVMEKLKSGELSENQKWTSPKKFQKIQELGKIVENTFSDSWKLKTKSFGVMMNIVKDSGEYWARNIKEHGLFGAVKNAFTKKKKKGWFDVNGGYYVLNDEETAYNYYNANGDLVSEDVDKDEVEEMKLNGLLTESDIIEDSDAQKAIKNIKEKISDIWQDAKANTGKVLDSVKRFLGIEIEENSSTSSGSSTSANDALDTAQNTAKLLTAATGMNVNLSSALANNIAGKGNDDPTPTSSSGTVNGFAYYSQNDPRFKNQAYNLSDGSVGTMGERGCGPAAMSMIASQLTGRSIDPVTMATAATNGGYSIDEGTTPEYFQNVASSMGIASSNVKISKDAIRKALASGTPMILQGAGSDPNSPFTSEGHYVVGVGLNGDNIVVNDPRGQSYSGEYSIDSMLPSMQNAWAFSNGSLINSNPYNALFSGNGPSGTTSAVSNMASTSSDVLGSATSIAANATSKTEIAKKLREQVVNAIRSRTGQNQYTQGSQRTQVGSGYGDCSATAQWALKTGANIDPGGYSGAQYTSSIGIDVDNTQGGPNESNLLPGDLLFYKRSGSSYPDGVGHVEMYVGDGKRMGHGSDKGPKETTLSTDGGTYLKARRFINQDASDYNSPALDPAMSASAASSAGSDVGLSSSQIEESTTNTTGEDSSSSSSKSILELLTGAASAFAAPIIEWMTGGKSDGTVGEETSNSLVSNASNLASLGMSIVGNNSSSTNSVPSAANISGSNVAEKTWNYFTSLGYSKPAISAILGNAEAESGLNPATIQGNGKGPAAGFFQWENYNNKSGRWKAMSDYAASKGKDWTDLESQLEFGHKEMMDPGSTFWKSQTCMSKVGAVPTTYEDWKQSTDVEMATKQFEAAFERAGKPNMETRISTAKGYYDLYKDMNPPNTTPESLKFIDSSKSIASSLANNNSNLVQAAGKGGSVTNVTDSNHSSRLETVATKNNETKIKLEEATDPLFRTAIELLTRIATSAENINTGVRDLSNKDFTSSTQIIDGETHNNIIPVPQKDKESQKDLTQYNTAKRISAGVYLA